MVDETRDMPVGAGGGEPTPRSVGLERGWGWIAEGFGYFKAAPGPWVVMAIILFVIAMVLSFIPLVGGLALNVISPILVGGLMLACRKQDRGETVEIGDLFSAFSAKGGPLAVVGVAYLAGIVVLMIVGMALGMLIAGGAAATGAMVGEGAGLAGLGMGMMIVMLAVTALAVPLMMAVWFAPALVVLGEQQPLEAMKQSFYGCVRNIGPFLLYGVAAFVISIVAMIPMGLGFLVWGPVLIASAYVGYRDIYEARQQAAL